MAGFVQGERLAAHLAAATSGCIGEMLALFLPASDQDPGMLPVQAPVKRRRVMASGQSRREDGR
jgi:hypothetical protein